MTDHSMTAAMHAMVQVRPWTATEFALRVLMWAAMMVAMMVPTAVPMTLVYAAVARKAAAQNNPLAPTFVFVAGYIAMWSLFSVAATAAQRGLDQLALLSPMMVSNSALLGSPALPVHDELLPGCFEFGAQHVDHLTQLAHLGPRPPEIIVGPC